MIGPCRTQSIRLAVEREDWQDVVVTILSRFEVYLHALRGGSLRDDEADLFVHLNSVVTGSQPEEGLSSFF